MLCTTSALALTSYMQLKFVTFFNRQKNFCMQCTLNTVQLDAKAVSPLRIVSLSVEPYAKKALILFCHDSAKSIQGIWYCKKWSHDEESSILHVLFAICVFRCHIAAKVNRSRSIRWSWFPSAHLSDNAAIQRNRAHFFKTKDAAEDPKADTIWC